MSRKDVNLETLDKQELIKEVLRLKQHVVQLRNVIAKKEVADSYIVSPDIGKVGREFNFKRFKRRHIALKLLYLGWDYEGFVVQESTSKTIERAVFDALLKTKLIESRESSNYHRCGRTDVNVSAFSQVISLDVRSNLNEGRGVYAQEGFEPPDNVSGLNDNIEEVNYTKLLNQALPENIRIISWAPVDCDFSARFDCSSRSYKYIFPIGHLDIHKMRDACKYFMGSHDFRNFCKFDRMTPDATTIRSIDSAAINVINEDVSGYRIVEFVIKSHAFLWHQIRCIVAVLIMIGEGKEEPNVIEKLLDVKSMPDKPQYSLAPAFPLILFDCQFDCTKLESWIIDPESVRDTIKRLQFEWTNHEIKSQMIRRCLNDLHPLTDEPVDMQCSILITERSRTPKPLDQRPVCTSSQKRFKEDKSKDLLEEQLSLTE